MSDFAAAFLKREVCCVYMIFNVCFIYFSDNAPLLKIATFVVKHNFKLKILKYWRVTKVSTVLSALHVNVAASVTVISVDCYYCGSGGG